MKKESEFSKTLAREVEAFVVTSDRKPTDFDQALIDSITDSINEKLDIPFLTEAIERILIEAVVSIIISLVISKHTSEVKLIRG